jgi:hypothetical protein
MDTIKTETMLELMERKKKLYPILTKKAEEDLDRLCAQIELHAINREIERRSKINTNCPACQGTDLSNGKPYIAQEPPHEGSIFLPMECENCGATWLAIYQLSGFTNLLNT